MQYEFECIGTNEKPFSTSNLKALTLYEGTERAGGSERERDREIEREKERVTR